MTRLFRYYLAALRQDILIHVQYRTSMAIWMLSLVIEPLIFLMVWQAVAKAQDGVAGNYTMGTFAAYFMWVMVVNHITFTWIMYSISFEIREGHLAARLLHPIHPIHKDVSDNFSYKLLGLVFLIPAFVIMLKVFQPEFHFVLWHLPAFVLALVMAAAVRFVLEWTVAQVAFWIVDTRAFNIGFSTLLLLFSGRFAPIDLFPDWFKFFGQWLPFRWLVAFPVEIMMGGLALQEILAGYAVLVLWGIPIGTCMMLVWRAGVKRFGAVGL